MTNTTAPPEVRPQRERVRAMFDAVSPRYDLLNHLLSAGQDLRWRARAVALLDPRPGERILDLCSGTGDLGFAVLRRVPGLSVVGVDVARRMLLRGVAKRGTRRLDMVQGDAEHLPLASGSVQGACVGFGIRNVGDPGAAFRDVRRVLAPGGRLVVLEFSTPPAPALRRAYHLYFHHVLPRVGGALSGHPDAYAYLPESVGRFPGPEGVAEALRAAGFGEVRWSRLSGGIAALHLARV